MQRQFSCFLLLVLIIIHLRPTHAQGTLTVVAGAANPPATNEVDTAEDLPMLQFILSADNTEDIRLNDITFTAAGTGGNDNSELTAVNLYVDVNANGKVDFFTDDFLGNGIYSSDNGTVNISGGSYIIPQNSSVTFLLTYDVSTAADNNDQFSASINATGDVDAIGVSSSLAPTVSGTLSGNTKTIVTSGTGNLIMSTGINNPGNEDVANNASDVEVLQLFLRASTLEDVRISALTLTASGSGHDVDDITAVQLFKDVDEDGVLNTQVDTQIGSNTTFGANNGTATFSSFTNDITAGSYSMYLIVYDLNGSASASETFATSLASSANITATGVTSSSSITPSGAFPMSNGTKTVNNTGTLTVTSGNNNSATTNESTSGTDIPMFQIAISANDTEDVTVTSLTLATSGTADESTDISQVRLFEDINNNGTLELNTDNLLSTISSASITSDNQDLTFSSLSSNVPASGTTNYIVVYDLAGSASTSETFILSFDSNSDLSGTGVTSSNSVSVSGATVTSNTKTIETTGSLVISQGENNTLNQDVGSGDLDVEIMQLKLTASSVEDVDINSITLTASGRGGNDNSELTRVEIYEDIDGDGLLDIASDNFLVSSTYPSDNGSRSFSNSGFSVPAGSSKYVLVVYDISTAADNNDYFTTRLLADSDLSATGATSSSSITPSGAPVYGSLLTVKTSGGVGSLTLTEGLNNPDASLEANSTQDLAVLQFNLKASNVEDITFTSLTVASSGSANENTDVTQAELYEDVDNDGLLNTAVDVSAATAQTFAADNGTVTFTVSSQTISQGTSKNYIVAFDLASAASAGETFQVSVLANVSVTGTGDTSSETINPDAAAPVSGGVKTISNTGTLTIAVGDKNPAATNESTSGTGIPVFQLAISANATENVTMTALTVATSGNADESTDISQVRLFEDVNDNGTLELNTDVLQATINSAAIISDNQDLTFSSLSNVISASSTKNFLIVYDLAGTASDSETFSLSFDNNADLSGTGVTTSNSVSVTGATINANTKTIGTTGSLVITEAESNPLTQDIGSGDEDVEILLLKLTASSVEEVTINSITLTANGSGGNDNSELTRVNLYEDVDADGILDIATDNFLVSSTYPSDNGSRSFSISGFSVPASESKYVLVVYDVSTAADNNDQFTTKLESNSDLSATGVTSTNSITPTGAPVYGALLTVRTSGGVGSLTLLEGLNNPGASLEANSTQNLAMLQFTLKASNVEDINFTSLKVASSGTAVENTDVTQVELYEDVDEDGLVNTQVDVSAATAQTFGADDGTVTFTVSSQTITQGTSKNYIVAFDLASAASAGETFQVSVLANANVTGTGATSSSTINPDAAAPVSGGIKTISNTGTLTVAVGNNNPSSTNESTSGTDIPVFQLAISANATENVTMTSLTVATSGTADESTDISQVRLFEDFNNNGTLEINTDVLQSTINSAAITSDNQDLTFSSLSNVIDASETKNFLIVYDLAGTASDAETFSLSFDSNSDLSGTGVTTSNSVLGQPSMPILKPLALLVV